MSLIFFKPVFQERIWGGTALQQWFPQEDLPDDIGECWAISAHENGLSIVENGRYTGKTLKALYEEHPELFGNPDAYTFPLLVKVLDANADLSVQVHPDDAYALEVEGELGKTECWYILDAKPDAKIIYGHTAQSKSEFIQLVEQGKWQELLVELPVKKGDFFYVPSGTVHALCAGTLVLEVQQSSDTTYRLYDYDRVDHEGNKRELHIEKSLAVTTIPHQMQQIASSKTVFEAAEIIKLVNNDFFTVEKMTIDGNFDYKKEADYVLATVIQGTGEVNQIPVSLGTSFLIPYQITNVTFQGKFEVMLTYV